MIKQYFNYWLFKLQATNQHGVHSPFLYALVCSCFYNKNWKNMRTTPWNSKKQDIISTLILKQLQLFIGQSKNEFKIDPLKIVFSKNKALSEYSEELKAIEEPQLTLIDNLHLQRESWRILNNTKQFVLLDPYFFGIIIQRPQQNAEILFLKIF